MKTKYPTEIHLIFSAPFQDLFQVIDKVISITIIGLDQSSYRYEIKRLSTLVILLKIKFNLKSVKFPLLNVKFLLPTHLDNHIYQYLAIKELSIVMKSYFTSESQSLDALDSASRQSNVFGSIANGFISIANFAKPRSSLNFRSKITLDAIQNLK